MKFGERTNYRDGGKENDWLQDCDKGIDYQGDSTVIWGDGTFIYIDWIVVMIKPH